MNYIIEDNRIYLENERNDVIAEVTFPMVEENVVTINHTYVDDSLRGQGIAGKLMELLVDKVKQENIKVIPTCSYAVNWLNKHPEYNELIK